MQSLVLYLLLLDHSSGDQDFILFSSEVKCSRVISIPSFSSCMQQWVLSSDRFKNTGFAGNCSSFSTPGWNHFQSFITIQPETFLHKSRVINVPVNMKSISVLADVIWKTYFISIMANCFYHLIIKSQSSRKLLQRPLKCPSVRNILYSLVFQLI